MSTVRSTQDALLLNVCIWNRCEHICHWYNVTPTVLDVEFADAECESGTDVQTSFYSSVTQFCWCVFFSACWHPTSPLHPPPGSDGKWWHHCETMSVSPSGPPALPDWLTDSGISAGRLPSRQTLWKFFHLNYDSEKLTSSVFEYLSKRILAVNSDAS